MIRKPLPKPPPPLERWNLLGVSDLSEPLPPIPWVCEPLGLAPGAVTLVAGYGYSRKTMAMQSLGLSVASGKRAWGVWTVRRGAFVHLDYEQGRRITQERYQRLARGMGFELQELDAGALRVACMPRAYLDEAGVYDELVTLVGDASLVLVDSLRAAFPHADENSSEVRTYLDVLSRVSERTGAAIAVIHHARKPSAENGGGATHSIRGSSALFDACQSVYVFAGEKDTPTRVHHQKDRVRGTTLEEFGLTSDDVPGPSGLRDGLVVRHLEAEQLDEAAESLGNAKKVKLVDGAAAEIVRTLSENGALNGGFHGGRRDVQALVSVRKQIFDTAWSKLLGAGVLVWEGSRYAPLWKLNSNPSSRPPPALPGGGDQDHSFMTPPPSPLRGGGVHEDGCEETGKPTAPPAEDGYEPDAIEPVGLVDDSFDFGFGVEP